MPTDKQKRAKEKAPKTHTGTEKHMFACTGIPQKPNLGTIIYMQRTSKVKIKMP